MRVGRYSLRWTLVIAVVLPLLTAAGAGSYLAVRAFEREAEERLQEDVELVARAIRLPVSRALEQDELAAVHRALESVFRINRVYGAYVYNVDGELIASAGAGERPAEGGRMGELAREGTRTGEYGRVGERRVYSYFVPLTDATEQGIGLLQVTRRQRDIMEHVARLRWQAGVVLALGLVVMTALVLVGHHGAVGSHLNRLVGSMAQVRRGERGHRAQPTGPREIAALAEALNRMLDSIAEAEREIEEGREAQRALEARLRRAERLAAIGRLAGGIAHELGTPLSVIDGIAQRTLRGETRDGPAADALRRIRSEVRRLERIVRQLLDFGRRGGGRKRVVEAAGLARSAADTVREWGEARGITLEVTGTDAPAAISAHPPRVEQALTNLLRNAIQAAESRVRISWAAGAEDVIFAIDDDGGGVAEEIMPHLFEPFFTTKPVGEGTGLGLAVVHGVAESHDARVEVDESRLGGARFRIIFPRAVPVEAGTSESMRSSKEGTDE